MPFMDAVTPGLAGTVSQTNNNEAQLNLAGNSRRLHQKGINDNRQGRLRAAPARLRQLTQSDQRVTVTGQTTYHWAVTPSPLRCRSPGSGAASGVLRRRIGRRSSGCQT